MEVSFFSSMTDEKLENLHSQLTTKYGKVLKVLIDDSRPIQERRQALIAQIPGNESEKKEEINLLREFVKERVFRTLKTWAMIIYLAMEKLADYRPFDEEKVSISFCRNIMNVSPNMAVTDRIFNRFLRKIDKFDEHNGCKSGEEYRELCKTFSLKIFGIDYSDSEHKINDLFDLLNANYHLLITRFKYFGQRFVFSEREELEVEGIKVWIMKEYICSPQFILAIAAEVYETTSIIRIKALHVIFKNKWLGYFSQTILERAIARLHWNTNIGEGFLKFAMHYFGISNIRQAREKKDLVLESILDGTIWHEEGHHKSHDDMSPDNYIFSYVFNNGDYNLGTVLKEMLADWSPQEGTRKGSFSRFLERSKTNPRQTTAEVYMYLSDNLFMSVEEKDDDASWGLFTDVAVGSAIYFIDPNGTVNFNRLADEKDKFYSFFLMKHSNLINRLLAVIKSSTYDLGIKKLNFDQLEQRVEEMHKDTSNNAKPLEKLRHESFYWIEIVDFLQQYSIDGWSQYQKILAKEALLLKQEILEMITNGNAKSYNYSLRNYIIARCTEIGIIDKVGEENAEKILLV
jgi:hypothetical protein